MMTTKSLLISTAAIASLAVSSLSLAAPAINANAPSAPTTATATATSTDTSAATVNNAAPTQAPNTADMNSNANATNAAPTAAPAQAAQQAAAASNNMMLAAANPQPAVPAPSTPAAAPSTNDAAAQMVLTLTKGQATIVQSFQSLGNLEGFVVKPAGNQKGQPTIIYADKEGQYAFVGALLTPDGTNQSAKDNQQYVVATIAQQAFADAKDTAWILDGNPNAKHMMYAVADPNCIYCNKFYTATRPFVKSGDLAIRWIWVGFLKQSSPGLAQAILAAKDPAQAMALDENKFNEATEQGGITPLANPPKDVMDKFNKNMAFLNKFQFPGTPVLLYTDQTGTPQAAFGLPVGDQLTQVINSMSTIQ